MSAHSRKDTENGYDSDQGRTQRGKTGYGDGDGSSGNSSRSSSGASQTMKASTVKDPDGDAEAPASMPKRQQGQGGMPHNEDLAGHQGGQRGGGPDVKQHS